ncbi:hypothetical protein [Pseudonocardia humida]|uniref:Uncharacterized protein n=1 Tax=Pseudonocardia humida TaxID=2800819 RepID=A0ABT0ZUY9_9PSEU|nr:hypothetical protein [Pseudonocardia humida]MCO1654498.1 hypothetical protein [Pseudonocardia humida]
MIDPPRDAARPRPRRRVARVLVAAVVVLSLLGAGRVAWVVAVPAGDGVRAEQLRFLESALADGAGQDMQELFPEGYFFSHVLTGLAAAQPAAAGDADALRVARTALDALGSPAGTAPFPDTAAPAHGVFWAGWSLALAVEVARLSGLPADRADVARRAGEIRDALVADDDGFLEAYPGQVWPCDTVVAVAALARSRALGPVPGVDEVVAGWTDRTRAVRDQATGLLPHRLDAGGAVLDGPRASSQALMLSFLPDIDPGSAAADYRRFVDAFVVRELGLVGVREYPVGMEGEGDVDSGPLIAGVSLSASAVALGAATRQGDAALAATLDAQAELFALPVPWFDGRRYAFGLLPVADAFLAWARAQSAATGATGSSGAPGWLWPGWLLLALVPAAVVLAVPRTRRLLLTTPAAGRAGSPAARR